MSGECKTKLHFHLNFQEENYISCIVDEESTQNGDGAPPATINLSAPSPVVVKQEATEDELVDVEADPVPAPQPAESDEESTRRPGLHYCQSCNITFNFPASYIAHKQYYCSTHARTRTSRTTTPETSVQ